MKIEKEIKIMKKTQKGWTKYIQDEIKKKGNYEDYKHVFVEYRDYLEKCLLENPRSVEIVCQLAAIYNELWYEWEKIYKLLNEFIKKYKSELTDKEKSRIYTNLGFYYDDQREGSKRAIRTLRKAVAFNPKNSKAYYGLGANYYGAGKYDKSEEMYEKACELENNPIYKFEYANLLIINKKYEKAKMILEELLKGNFDFWKSDLDKIKYIYIVNRIRLKEFGNIEAEIDELMLENVNNDDFFENEFAELYYLAGSYDKSKELYSKMKKGNYEVAAWWLLPYFYSMKQLNKKEELQKEFEIAIKIKNEEIEEIKNGEFLTECTKSYKKEKIREIKRQIKNLKVEYEKILKTDYKPEVKIYPKFLYDCFLIDCPRHQKLD